MEEIIFVSVTNKKLQKPFDGHCVIASNEDRSRDPRVLICRFLVIHFAQNFRLIFMKGK